MTPKKPGYYGQRVSSMMAGIKAKRRAASGTSLSSPKGMFSDGPMTTKPLPKDEEIKRYAKGTAKKKGK